eukprot:3939829-Rhodomonas_salina.1
MNSEEELTEVEFCAWIKPASARGSQADQHSPFSVTSCAVAEEKKDVRKRASPRARFVNVEKIMMTRLRSCFCNGRRAGSAWFDTT